MRITYLSHIDAGWIKQRPHFLAEELQAAGNDVSFVYARAFRSRQLVVGAKLHVASVVPLTTVPQRLRGAFGTLDGVVQAAHGRRLPETDVVWVCHPRLWTLARQIVTQTLSRPFLVYDCMDRVSQFETAATIDVRFERDLVLECDQVFASSEPLAGDMRAAGARNVDLVRNGLDGTRQWRVGGPNPATGEKLRLGYFGTISRWFDWSGVRHALRRNNGWTLHLWGPTDSVVPDDPQIVHHGSVPHEELNTVLAMCDVMVMPFLVDSLIEAVDPVKAYEYVASGLPVVLSDYPAVAHFERFVEFYSPSDGASFESAIVRAITSPREYRAISTFVEENTWKQRAAQVVDRLPGPQSLV